MILHDDIDRENLEKLREVCRKVLPNHKIKVVVAIMADSTILHQVEVLKETRLNARFALLGLGEIETTGRTVNWVNLKNTIFGEESGEIAEGRGLRFEK